MRSWQDALQFVEDTKPVQEPEPADVQEAQAELESLKGKDCFSPNAPYSDHNMVVWRGCLKNLINRLL